MAAFNVHSRSLATSTALMEYYVESAIPPSQVIAILNQEGIQFMLVGAHGLGGWTQKPRATEDVDVLVAARHQKKAVRVLLVAFPHLEAVDFEVVTRLRDRKTRAVAIDVLKPNQPLFRVGLKHTQVVSAGDQAYKIPTLEFALAMKFASMISLNRQDPDKYQDAADFARMVLANAEINADKLAELGDLVYPEGGKELLEKVRQVRAGEKLNL
jgi:hypothetical protein